MLLLTLSSESQTNGTVSCWRRQGNTDGNWATGRPTWGWDGLEMVSEPVEGFPSLVLIFGATGTGSGVRR